MANLFCMKDRYSMEFQNLSFDLQMYIHFLKLCLIWDKFTSPGTQNRAILKKEASTISKSFQNNYLKVICGKSHVMTASELSIQEHSYHSLYSYSYNRKKKKTEIYSVLQFKRNLLLSPIKTRSAKMVWHNKNLRILIKAFISTQFIYYP